VNGPPIASAVWRKTHNSSVRPAAVLGLIAVAILFVPALPVVAAPVSYIYDDLGRLIAVIDEASETAIYEYDAVGNLLSISRQDSDTVKIIDFRPKKGPIGTSVTILGTGFSTTPSQNTVTFNGSTATVTSASKTELVATVPSGATTGPIGVTAPGGSTTSSSSFTVTATDGLPTITNFTPAVGAPGDAVTVNGTNFDPTPLKNKLGFNATKPTLGKVTTATATALNTNVPITATSGHLRVVTEAGAAESTADFFVAPPPYAAADVAATGRVTVGGSGLNVAIGTANKIGLVVFDGVAGQRLSLGWTNHTLGSTPFHVFQPDGRALTSVNFNGVWDLPKLLFSGTYTILADPPGVTTGSTTLIVSQELTGTITIGGPAVPVSITRAGQRARLTFQGTAGQRLDLRGGSSSISDGAISVLTAAEASLGAGVLNLSGADTFPSVLPSTGTFQILVDPAFGNTGNVTLTLSEEVTAAITVGGDPVTVNLPRAGQRARVTFEGVAGQRLNVGMAPTAMSGNASVLTPSGTTLISGGFGSVGTAIDTPPLPVTGTYTVLVDPGGDSTGSLTLTLSEELTGSIVVNGDPVTINITRAGQRARLTFTGTSGQRLSLGTTASTLASANASILNPDGSTLVFPVGFGTPASAVDTPVLPATGTYTLFIDPNGINTGNVTLTLSAEVTGTIVVNGSSMDVSVTRAGQRARISFEATAGQQLGIGLVGSTFATATVTVFRPNGDQWTVPMSFFAGNAALDVGLPSAGTHTILIDPAAAHTGSLTLWLSQEQTWAVTPGGPAINLSVTRPAQRVRLTFSGTPGQRVAVVGGSGTISQTAVTVIRPNGLALGGGSAFPANGGFLDLRVLVDTGTHFLLLDPDVIATGDKTVTFLDVPADVLGSLTINDPAVPVTISAIAQNGHYTFAGTNGQAITVRVTNNAIGCMTIVLRNPSGGVAASVAPCGASANLAHTPNATGTYTIDIDPSDTATGTFDLRVTNP